jgi:hypothetical protein
MLAALRTWAYDALFAGRVNEPPAASADEWDFFLAVERCAISLESQTGHLLTGMPRQRIKHAAILELQRAMSAQAELREVGHAATARGWNVVVLKGAAHSGPDPIDVLDLDLLVDPVCWDQVAAWYKKRGWTLFKGPQYTQACKAASVQVDLHRVLREWNYDMSERLTHSSGVGYMKPPDHVWHLLLHIGIKHGDRQSCLRDMLLIETAWKGCSSADRERVARLVGGHEYGSHLQRVLDAATMREGDVFFQEAVWRYAIWRMVGLGERGYLANSLALASLDEIGTARRDDLVGTPPPVGGRSGINWIARIEQILPAAGTLIHTGGRDLKTLAARALAGVCRAQASRVVSAHLRNQSRARIPEY